MSSISPFTSFWMAGYECSDKLNAFGNRVDFLNITGHIDAVYEDYAMLQQLQQQNKIFMLLNFN